MWWTNTGRRLGRPGGGDRIVRLWPAATPEQVAGDPESAYQFARAAASLASQGRGQEAEQLFREARDILQRTRASEDPATRVAAGQVGEAVVRLCRRRELNEPLCQWEAFLPGAGSSTVADAPTAAGRDR